jgi:hypothetical protein
VDYLSARNILDELVRRRVEKKDINFLESSFPAQTNFILDPSKKKAVQCTRRAGKSFGGGLYLVKEIHENPGVSCLYIALTRLSAKAIMWKDVYKPINDKYNLGLQFNQTTLTIAHPNGSIIYNLGVDTDEKEREKILGQKFKLIVIDEAASFSIDMLDLIERILGPTIVDYGGTICMIGTAGNLTKSYYYDVTNGKIAGWSVHKWSAEDNTFIADKWKEHVKEITSKNPLIIETAWFKQMYLNQWVIDTDKLVYKFSETKNRASSLPLRVNGQWTFVLGVDLGYEDDSAFTVCTYHDFDPNLYIVETFKKPKMDITDVAIKIKALVAKYDIAITVIDGANKQAVQEMINRHDLSLVAANKTGKEDFIELMNADLITGRIKVFNQCIELMDEWRSLIWDDSKLKKVEHASCANHQADSCLYAWRYCYQYLSREEKSIPKLGSKEWANQQVQEMEDAAEQRLIEEQNQMGYEQEGL